MNITIWEGTTMAPAAKLRVSLIESDGINHTCKLTCAGRRVLTAAEAEPLVVYAEAEFGAQGEYRD